MNGLFKLYKFRITIKSLAYTKKRSLNPSFKLLREPRFLQWSRMVTLFWKNQTTLICNLIVNHRPLPVPRFIRQNNNGVFEQLVFSLTSVRSFIHCCTRPLNLWGSYKHFWKGRKGVLETGNQKRKHSHRMRALQYTALYKYAGMSKHPLYETTSVNKNTSCQMLKCQNMWVFKIWLKVQMNVFNSGKSTSRLLFKDCFNN